MFNKQTRFNHSFLSCWVVAFILTAFVAPLLRAMDVQFPTLKIETDVFTNVTVYQMNATDIFIRHSRGFGNAKINTLDDETLIVLGLKERKPEKPEKPAIESPVSTAQVDAAVEQVKTALSTVNLTIPSEELVREHIARVTSDPRLLYGIVGGLAFVYLLYCLCLRSVCVNAGSKPGLLIWLPVLQMFPLLRAARMPAWWFLIFCLPCLDMIPVFGGLRLGALLGLFPVLAHLLWCARITRACGKGFFAALMLFLPGTNILALLYLAFSGGGGGEPPVRKAVRHEDMPGFARA